MSHTIGACDFVCLSKRFQNCFSLGIVCGPLLECLFDGCERFSTTAFRRFWTWHPTFDRLSLQLHVARIIFARLFVCVELCNEKGHL